MNVGGGIGPFITYPSAEVMADVVAELQAKLEEAQEHSVATQAKFDRLDRLVNAPHVDNFLEAVRLEAAHQVERWGTINDEGKSPTDWYWLLGYLAGKAVWAATHGDREKALHHTISSAAVLLNWHAYMAGDRSAMRPGIADPEGTQP